MNTWKTIGAAGMVAAVVAGCGGAEGEQADAVPGQPQKPAAVQVTGGEYYFKAPERVPAGQSILRFRNEGRETHQMAVARLAPGVSLQRAIATGGEGGTATPLGEVVARPGVQAELSVDLTPGRYALLCFEEGRRKRPHLALGQTAQFEVG